MDFRDWDGDDITAFIFIVFVCILLTLGIIGISSNHKVKFYYMSGDSGVPMIKGEVNWGDDITIKLPPNISFLEATELMDKMNKSLPK